MLSTLLTIAVVVVLYLHIVFQLKTNNELEIYEISFQKEKLEEVCDLKQPVLFDYEDPSLELDTSDYGTFDVVVHDQKYRKSIVPLDKAKKLFEKNYVMIENEEFLKDTLLKNQYTNTDLLLRPPLVCNMSYDICMGSDQYTTRLQYKNQYRNYFAVTKGSITVKLCPPRNAKFLNEIKKYESQDFYSTINPWKEKTKVKFLEITVPKGKLLFIPAYWWYSIKLEKDACVCIFHYRTIMNVLATLPDLSLGLLQRQNTKIKIVPRDSPASSDESRT
jgi:hypothetical protein